jgi:hypothetical protein
VQILITAVYFPFSDFIIEGEMVEQENPASAHRPQVSRAR